MKTTRILIQITAFVGLFELIVAAESAPVKTYWVPSRYVPELRAEQEKITDCMECGACAYTCPAKRPLLDYIRLGKTTVIKMARERVTK